ncbi:uncharacterized protein JCM15063_006233 [Sporobolomyces koalae]|uniref:uncharacterized protein n=1 Tax=Sporobolomyces koalae TaxID=500713 RepID=UPI00317E49BB
MSSSASSSTSSAPPLLGTPYLQSQSTTTTRITPSLCSNLTQFKRLIAQSRTLDDAITTRLNRQSALSSNRLERGCDEVWRELRERWTERNEVLTYCDQALGATNPVDLESNQGTRIEIGLSADKGQLGRGRSTVQDLKRQQLQMEFSTERIIRHRTLDLLLSKCPHLVPDSTVEVPRAIGEVELEQERTRRRGRDERGSVRWA